MSSRSGRKFKSQSSIKTTTATTVKEHDGVDKLFYTYANKLSRTIEPEGVEKLCSEAGLSVTDVRVLMLAWKMKAERQGYFTLEEWRNGFKALNVETIGRLKDALQLNELQKVSSKFTEFFSYAFQYCLTEDKQKIIEIESACELLGIVLKNQFPSQVEAMIEYLTNQQKEYKAINMDQWMGFLRFCSEVSFPDLSNYDPDLAWPSILDDFADWVRETKT